MKRVEGSCCFVFLPDVVNRITSGVIVLDCELFWYCVESILVL